MGALTTILDTFDIHQQVAYHHHLYPLSSKELIALKKQINEWLESGHIVLSISTYSYPVLFDKKKGGEGFGLYVCYHALNAKAVTDAWPLPCIDDLLS